MTVKNKWIIGSIVGLSVIGLVNASPYSAQPAPIPSQQQFVRSNSSTIENVSPGVTEGIVAPSNNTKSYQEKVIPAPQSVVRSYTNSVGNRVQSPTYYNAQPSGASARCGDGTYSFSQSRRGTCSHHGGVSRWL